MADEPETTDTPQGEANGEATGRDQKAVEQVADVAPAGAAESAVHHDPRTPKERRSDRRAVAVAKRGGARRGATPEEREAERRRKAAQRRAYRANLKTRRAANPRETTPQLTKDDTTGAQKVRLGIVVSDKADKTITVRIDVARRHRRYQKTIRSSTTLHAHDERNEAGIGDTVRVVEARPLSRTKRWRLVEVIEKAR
jgi:small subunit ribosomal protein S17